MSAAYLFALLLPLCAGAALYFGLFGTRRTGLCSAALGYGAVLGLLLAAAVTSLTATADTAHAWRHAWPWLALIAVTAGVLGWRRLARHSAGGDRESREPSPRPWQYVLLAGLYATLAWRAWLAAREIWLRPLYPWDAWSAWAVKAKVWFLLGHHVAYVPPREWLADKTASLYTAVAWFYPDATSWLDVWFASAAGGWVEPLVNLPWLIVWIALLLGHHGQWRALGLGRLRALFFVYLLGSLPLLTVHVALAGYSDLWVATVFAFSVLAWMRWLQAREPGQLALALLCAALLPFLKLEGWVWALSLYAAFGLAALPPLWRRVAGFGIVLVLVSIASGGLRFAFVKLGWVDAAGAITNSRIGAFDLLLHPRWHDRGLSGMAEALFAHPNWHLLWWLLPAVLALRWRYLAARQWLFAPAILLLACLGAVAFLFTFTDAANWAENFTAINRLVLQLTPAVVSLLALLLQDVDFPAAEHGTDPTRDPRSDPG